jgi:hypothetical protein
MVFCLGYGELEGSPISISTTLTSELFEFIMGERKKVREGIKLNQPILYWK